MAASSDFVLSVECVGEAGFKNPAFLFLGIRVGCQGGRGPGPEQEAEDEPEKEERNCGRQGKSKTKIKIRKRMAERGGFEPPVGLSPLTLSRRAL